MSDKFEGYRINGDDGVPLLCQECGVEMGRRFGPMPDKDAFNAYCFDCAPLELAEAAMNARPEPGSGVDS